MNTLSDLTEQEQKALLQFKAEVARICGTKKWEIRLFGSRARREGDEDSDVDLLVLIDEPDRGTKTRIWDAAYDVFSSTDIAISPQVLSHAQFGELKARERLIALTIEREGIPV